MPEKQWNEAQHSLRVNRERLVEWGKDLGDPWVRQRLERLVADHEACLSGFECAAKAAERLPELRHVRRRAQRQLDCHALVVPARWRRQQRKAWEQQGAAQWQRFVSALQAERDAFEGAPTSVQPALVARSRLLLRETEAIELALKALLPVQVAIQDHAKTTRQPQPFAPKATKERQGGR